jgi:hypothetical protein
VNLVRSNTELLVTALQLLMELISIIFKYVSLKPVEVNDLFPIQNLVILEFHDPNQSMSTIIAALAQP